ncbi:Ribosomal RNA large subunit methyltransferase I [BD1-7 clade bacterium]|uniref:Ribosomal RNA large subunit methyltransferase I n=1 Tax=BD1-7 clade bacterium TaxID=2029982 RepID=A0A5S9R093_9GAMM|nr:Ribosomal RNA large subunit methyltransferase I [BD1-7 clade bacterium]
MYEMFESELAKAFDQLPADASRLFHGRGHCFDGLEFVNVDWFSPVVWVVMYGDVDDSVFVRLCDIVKSQAERTPSVEAVLVQHREKGKSVQDVIYGDMPDACVAHEAGESYALTFGRNQNIGFFLDAKPARQWVRENAEGKRVLNLFAYTCSFSVAALAGGAQSVVNIDMAKSALATGKINHKLNKFDGARVSFLPHDVFRSTRKLAKYGPYDLVICDPPSRQKGSFEADKDYARLIGKLEPMLAEDAQIMALLNAPYLDEDFLPDIFAEKMPSYQFVERLPQRQDFPESDNQCCLKMQLFMPIAS